jgi:hypothetical protein
LYNNQGFHLNKFGKIDISKQIANTIASLQKHTLKVPISVNWYISSSGVNNLDTSKCIVNFQPSTHEMDSTGQHERNRIMRREM